MDLNVVLKKILILVNLNLIYEKVYGSLPSQTACAGKLFILFLHIFAGSSLSVNDKEITKHYTQPKMLIYV